MVEHSILSASKPAGDRYVTGDYRSYFTGFILAAVLTVIPFAVVMTGALESRLATTAVVVVCAFAQILVHMVYFLHMDGKGEDGWPLTAALFTVIIMVIILAGTLWVMHNMNVNMMPAMNHELIPSPQ